MVLILVDCVISFGVINVLMDEWGLDVVVLGVQKGYMFLLGLSFVVMSVWVWEVYECFDLFKFYLDLGFYWKIVVKDSNFFILVVNFYFGLEVVLEMMQKEGLDVIFVCYVCYCVVVQVGMKVMGLFLFVVEGCGSLVIIVVVFEGIDVEQLCKVVKEKFDIFLVGG